MNRAALAWSFKEAVGRLVGDADDGGAGFPNHALSLRLAFASALFFVLCDGLTMGIWE